MYHTLVRSLGCDCDAEPEVKEGNLNVRVIVDRPVRKDDSGLIAWEDMSPVVFGKHCTYPVKPRIHFGKLRYAKTAGPASHHFQSKGIHSFITAATF